MAKGTTTAPIERKVAIPSATAILVTLISWLLVTYVPAFKTGIPTTLVALLPGAVSWIIATVTAYYTKHTPREVQTDIDAVIQQALAAYEEAHPALQPLKGADAVTHSGSVTVTHHAGGIGVAMQGGGGSSGYSNAPTQGSAGNAGGGGAGGGAPMRPAPEPPIAGDAWPSD